MSAGHQGLLKCENCLSRDKGIFCDLQADDLQNVNLHKVVNSYKRGQTLFVQGNPPFGLFCISHGNIKVSKIGPDGKESIVKVAKAGDILGHRSLFTQTNYSATATAMEDTSVCFIDKKFIIQLVQERPSVSRQIIQQLSRSLGAAEDRVASLAQKNVRERFAELILLLKESHGVVEDEKRTRLDIKMTREEMASLIGTAPETLIRLVSELKEEGVLDQKGKTLYICNEESLLNQAGLGY